MLKRTVLLLGVTVVCLVCQHRVLPQDTFSLPVTSDKGGYIKFDKVILGEFHSGDDYYNSDLRALATNCGFVAKKIIEGQGDHGLGNTVIIRHDLAAGPVYSLYGHLVSFASEIEEGKPVSRGQFIGTIGKTGKGSNNIVHLHFEIKRGPTLANPSPFGSNAADSQWGYVPIQAGKSKASSATDYGYFRPSSYYGGYVASCPLPKAVVATSLRFSQGNGPFEVGQKLDGSFTIANRGNAKLVMKQLVIGGRFADTCPNNQCPDFQPIPRDITLEPGQTKDYVGTTTLLREGTYTFYVAYEKSDGKWDMPVNSENGTINKLSVKAQGAKVTLNGTDPAVVYASSKKQIVYLTGTRLATILYCRVRSFNGLVSNIYIPLGEVTKGTDTRFMMNTEFRTKGTYYITAYTLVGTSNELAVQVR